MSQGPQGPVPRLEGTRKSKYIYVWEKSAPACWQGPFWSCGGGHVLPGRGRREQAGAGRLSHWNVISSEERWADGGQDKPRPSRAEPARAPDNSGQGRREREKKRESKYAGPIDGTGCTRTASPSGLPRLGRESKHISGSPHTPIMTMESRMKLGGGVSPPDTEYIVRT